MIGIFDRPISTVSPRYWVGTLFPTMGSKFRIYWDSFGMIPEQTFIVEKEHIIVGTNKALFC